MAAKGIVQAVLCPLMHLCGWRAPHNKNLVKAKHETLRLRDARQADVADPADLVALRDAHMVYTGAGPPLHAPPTVVDIRHPSPEDMAGPKELERTVNMQCVGISSLLPMYSIMHSAMRKATGARGYSFLPCCRDDMVLLLSYTSDAAVQCPAITSITIECDNLVA